jgi:hypothetical protein
MTDFNTWQKELSSNKNVSLKSYPSLNHLFMNGEGKATPEEYNKPGTVDKEPVMDIITWIENRQ